MPSRPASAAALVDSLAPTATDRTRVVTAAVLSSSSSLSALHSSSSHTDQRVIDSTCIYRDTSAAFQEAGDAAPLHNNTPSRSCSNSSSISGSLPHHNVNAPHVIGAVEDALDDSGSRRSSTPHAAVTTSALLSPTLQPSAPPTPQPQLPRRKISLPIAQPVDAAPPMPSLASRRMWTHFAEREILTTPATSAHARSSMEEGVGRQEGMVSATAGPVAAGNSVGLKSVVGVLHYPQAPSSPSLSVSSVSPRPVLSAHTHHDDDDVEDLVGKNNVSVASQSIKATEGPSGLPTSTARNTSIEVPRGHRMNVSSSNNNTNNTTANTPIAASATSSNFRSPMSTESILLPGSIRQLPLSPRRVPHGPAAMLKKTADDDADKGEVNNESFNGAGTDRSSPSPYRASSASMTPEDGESATPTSCDPSRLYHHNYHPHHPPPHAHSPAAAAAEGDAKGGPAALPALTTFSATFGGERDSGSSGGGFLSQPPTAPLSMVRPRRSQHALPHSPHRQVSLSFEGSEEDKAAVAALANSALSATNSDSLPPHGLSPSSATAPSVTSPPPSMRAMASLSTDLLWGARNSRIDLRATCSPSRSPQRHDLDALPARSASTTLADRRAPLAAPLRCHHVHHGGPADGGNYRRTESATFRPTAQSVRSSPRTRSAAYSATARSIRNAQFANTLRPAELLPRSPRQSRSGSAHSARFVFPPRTMLADEESAAEPSIADAPLLPHLSPLADPPLSAPRTSASLPGVTPVQRRLSAISGTFDDDDGDADTTAATTEYSARSRSTSADPFRSFHGRVPATTPAAPSLGLPLDRRTQTPLPAIPSTSLAASSCRTEPGVSHDVDDDAADTTGPAHHRSTPRQSRVSFSIASTRNGSDDVAERRSPISSLRHGSASSEMGGARFAASTPPPPPWTPAEALYWMSGRLTRQEALELARYDAIYYCGPAVPPRTACGVSETKDGDDETAAAAGRAEASSLPHHAAAAASYFPVSLGMHVSFRYEVVEVLGFGTFSVVVRAIDHAAQPGSAERHCALKFIRKEDLYQEAAKEEWAVYETVKACCRTGDGDGGDVGANGHSALWKSDRDVHLELTANDYPPLYRHRFSSFASAHSPSFTTRLSSEDQRTLAAASVLTPRTRFEFRGYMVIVFPLLGFNVRDVMELLKESEKADKAEDKKEESEKAGDDAARPVAAAVNSEDEVHHTSSVSATRLLSGVFPAEVLASVLAQVVHALAFLHNIACLLHGDLKPENVVFVDRALASSGGGSGAEQSASHAFLHQLPQHHNVLLTSVESDAAHYFTPTSASMSGTSSMRPSITSVPFPAAASLYSKSVNDTAAQRGHTSQPPAADAPKKEAIVRSGEGEGEEDAVLTIPSTSAFGTSINWLRECTSEETRSGEPTTTAASPNVANETSTTSLPPPCAAAAATSPVTRDLQGSLSLAYVPHTPSRRTPGLTSSRTTATLSSPQLPRAARSPALEIATTPLSPAVAASGDAFAAQHYSQPYHHHHGDSGSSTGSPSHSMRDSTTTPSGGAGVAHAIPSRVPFASRVGRNLSAHNFEVLSPAHPHTAAASTSRVAVIDLGHAKPLAPGQTGVVFPLQSPSYRAPEMALRLPYTTAVDMWSLGCVLYELRTSHVLLAGASDDATMLAAAVQALGMPDTNFLSLVKVCWKEYKQRKNSTSTLLPRRRSSNNSSVVAALAGHPNTSLSVYLTEQAPEPRNTAETPHLRQPQSVTAAEDAAAAAVVPPSEEEAAVEGCWKGFIQVLNSTAGKQRARAERRRRQSASAHLSGTTSLSTSPRKEAAVASAAASPASPLAADYPSAAVSVAATTSFHSSSVSRAARTTFYETEEQCALLRALFPGGVADAAEQTFSLEVADALRRPSVSVSSAASSPTCSRVTDGGAVLTHELAWADFVLGCLYWDAAERLTAAEAQRHPYLAAHFSEHRKDGREGEVGDEGEEENRRIVAAALDRAHVKNDPLLGEQTFPVEQLPHCSGVYYLQRHPLSARLFSGPPYAVSRKRDVGEADRQERSQSFSQLRRRSSLLQPVLSLAPTAIVPFDLPSHKRAAPSARAWEEQQQQQQQQQMVMVVSTDINIDPEAASTPQDQGVSAFGDHTSPPAPGHAGRSNSTTPFRLDFYNSDEPSSTCEGDLLSPERAGTSEVDVRDTSMRAEEEEEEEGDVMVLRLE